MDKDCGRVDSDMAYPILFIPKKCTTLETNCDTSENVYIDLNITSPDTEGNETCIYSGFCNVKLIESLDNIQRSQSPENSSSDNNDIDQMPVILSEDNQMTFPTYNQSRVWIDPSRSPYVYNHYDAATKEQFSIRESRNCITVEQHNTYITQNVYNYKESNVYNYKEHYAVNDFEHKKFRKVPETAPEANLNYYEEDEFECGVFLSQLPEEIMNEKNAKERRIHSEDNALKQLMSSDIQSESKQRRTILYLGEDSSSGQTIQNISYNDPTIKCAVVTRTNENVNVSDSDQLGTKKKSYQCDKCKQIFCQISDFHYHMVGKHITIPPVKTKLSYVCNKCGKTIKNLRKFEIHCVGHGDPDLECDKCHKVYASKFTLKAHYKIHNREYQCRHCPKSFDTVDEWKMHLEKSHSLYKCVIDNCPYETNDEADYKGHDSIHKACKMIENDYGDSLDSIDSSVDANDFGIEQTELKNEDISEEVFIEDNSMDTTQVDRIKDADSVLAKVMSNKIFLLNSKKAKKHKYNKSCEVCRKTFDRISDLKRHLIEHVIRSTLAKTPVSKSGTLTIVCEVCNKETFTKIDTYKAHLREHAKLTIYKCTFCDKSFSDSSNFSKHKKIHGLAHLQCDLCQRKFNSKKMIAQHMEYHIKNSPVKCKICNKVFHFESMLNKHVKSAHTKSSTSRFHCRFCENIFKCLKDKWDHEWEVHNVRKMIIDCRICGDKFRKYSELKRHCNDDHYVDIPPARKLFRRKRYY